MEIITRIFVFLMSGVMFASCSSIGSGAAGGAMFGGMIGSAIGGIAGGYHGSNLGTLIGMAGGAAGGAAIGAAAEKREQRLYDNQEMQYDGTPYDNRQYGNIKEDEYHYVIQTSDPAQQDYNKQPMQQNIDIKQLQAAEKMLENTVTEPIVIENVEFIGKDGNAGIHIGKGDLVKIAFDFRNTQKKTFMNVMPMVEETTKNKYLLISPAITIESIGPTKALRYTAFVSAQKNLKGENAHFVLYINSEGVTMSNKVEFDVPLN